ncbi:MAG: hypothetical protein UY92_C0012G0025 [Candidatus Magasanikbacteria bacterium GW2011_GWA2_56_11]|uniref:3D domain-containing protein n=1 Tax=Candidatus Magasanikbacteria bacterium GW2011_GWA2_56_11 TaxID=1619044 RepID=A0A0G1YFB9_9BACT|nr:MAG: hypothetical protein UY92_C0012G0025 [Candidatus Magasanikbacteria bacterium GW2011_GWA2_56_11]
MIRVSCQRTSAAAKYAATVVVLSALLLSSARPQLASAQLDPGASFPSFLNIEAVIAETLADTVQEEKPEFPDVSERIPKRAFTVVATAYSSDPYQTDSTPCIPAMAKFNLCEYYETYGVEDTIATNILPLGTYVRFPELYGERVFTVRDRMNAKYNGRARIDFWKKDKPSAVQFGVKRIKMEVF